jgi:DNA polymerase-1
VPCPSAGIPSESYYRQTLFPAYEGGRQFDDELVDRLDVLPQLVAACGFANTKRRAMGSTNFSRPRSPRRNGAADGPSLRVGTAMRSARVGLHDDPATGRAGEMARIGPAEVLERYEFGPSQVPDFVAPRGDPSDKLPGATGVGSKGAVALLRKYANLRSQSPMCDLGLRLTNCGFIGGSRPWTPRLLPVLYNRAPAWGTAASLSRAWDLNRLAERLYELSPTTPEV